MAWRLGSGLMGCSWKLLRSPLGDLGRFLGAPGGRPASSKMIMELSLASSGHYCCPSSSSGCLEVVLDLLLEPVVLL